MTPWGFSLRQLCQLAQGRRKIELDGPCLVAATFATVMGREAVDPNDLHPLREPGPRGNLITGDNLAEFANTIVKAGKRGNID